MSYILEALKLSEQVRRQSAGDAPVSLLPPATAELSARRSRLPGILLAVSGIAIAAGAVWLTVLRPTPPAAELPPIPISPTPAVETAPPQLVASTSLSTLPNEAVPSSIIAATVTAGPSPTAVAAPTGPAVRPTPLAQQRAGTKTTSKTGPAAGDDPASGIEKQLPPLVLSGKFRDGEVRFVIVNDRVMREGEEVAPGLTIDRITDEDVFFLFKGHRFRR